MKKTWSNWMDWITFAKSNKAKLWRSFIHSKWYDSSIPGNLVPSMGKSRYSAPQAATGRCGSSKDFWFGTFKGFLFPTCQVRVVRFYDFYVSHPGRFCFFCFLGGIFVGTFCFFGGGFVFAQLMVWGWWFGARWFGFRLDPRKWKGLFLKGTRIRIPNHQFTLSWFGGDKGLKWAVIQNLWFFSVHKGVYYPVVWGDCFLTY